MTGSPILRKAQLLHDLLELPPLLSYNMVMLSPALFKNYYCIRGNSGAECLVACLFTNICQFTINSSFCRCHYCTFSSRGNEV